MSRFKGVLTRIARTKLFVSSVRVWGYFVKLYCGIFLLEIEFRLVKLENLKRILSEVIIYFSRYVLLFEILKDENMLKFIFV